MTNTRIRIQNSIVMAGVIAIFLSIAICGSRTCKKMKVREEKTSIPAEESSWSESRTFSKDLSRSGNWHKNFKVIE